MIIARSYLKTVTTLAKIIDSSDTCRRHHCYKVERYSLLVCKKLKLSYGNTKIIKVAAMLHDIGKIGIDLNIIRKPGKLTAAEWAVVRLHPEIGNSIIGKLGFLGEVTPMIKHHHERFGGGGYPDPEMVGTEIPMGSRIISVVDAFDAMTSERPYRSAMSKDAALAELARCSGSQFDPEVVSAFSEIKV